MEKILIRKGTVSDLPSVLKLINELALFEKEPDEVTNSLEHMKKDFDSDNPVFHLLIAELNNVVVGIAIYFIKYSTWKGKGVYLDDLVVTESMRNNGIGKLLFDEVVRDSKRLQAKQLHWQVLDWNDKAIRFYQKYNASFDKGWVDCKLTASQINNFDR